MKLLFLDVDGVLNCGWRWKGPLCSDLDHQCLSNLCWIVEQTDCKIVVSSTWRLYGNDCAGLIPVLYEYGIGDAVIGKTVELNEPRYVEIKTWLKENKGKEHSIFPRFAIVDDDDDAGIGFKKQYFETSMAQGLTREIAEAIILYLNEV